MRPEADGKAFQGYRHIFQNLIYIHCHDFHLFFNFKQLTPISFNIYEQLILIQVFF